MKFKAKVVRVIDGDTVDLDIDLGFYITHRVRGRLLRVDTPERGHVDWHRAKAVLATLLETTQDAEGYVDVTTYKTGKYGRWLVDINGVNNILEKEWPYGK